MITGAAGQLGGSYQKEFLSRGAKVVGIDIVRSSVISSLAHEYGDSFLFCEADVTIKDSLINCLRIIKEKFGPPTVLINNAAIDSPPGAPSAETGPFEAYPEQLWDSVIGVNLKGVFLACQVFGGDMARNRGGSIVNIASIYGLVAPDQSIYDYRRKRGEVFFKPAAYAVSKSGVINLTRYLSAYWAKKNVRVNTLSIAGVFNNQDPEFIDAYTTRIPIGRMAESSEYNGAIVFLASDASSYMTGSNLVIDGGWTAI